MSLAVIEQRVSGFFQNSRLHYIGTWHTKLQASRLDASHCLRRSAAAPSCVYLADRQQGFLPTPRTTPHFRAQAIVRDRNAAEPRSVVTNRPSGVIVWLHVDMDSFFVTAALLDHPELASRPVGVCHTNKRRAAGLGEGADTAELSSCNYVARNRGVRKGMFLRAARQLCPELVLLDYDFAKLARITEQVYAK